LAQEQPSGEETTKQPVSRPVLNVSVQDEIGSNSASNSPAVLASGKSQVLVLCPRYYDALGSTSGNYSAA
jgi:hypothetical protein